MGIKTRTPGNGRIATSTHGHPERAAVTPSSFLTGIPLPPRSLKDEGRRRWTAHCVVLKAKGVLSPDFLQALEHLCKLHDQIDQIDTIVKADGLMVGGSKGQKRSHPLLPERGKLMLLVRTMLADFGLTPGSARNVNVATNGLSSQRTEGIETADRDAEPF